MADLSWPELFLAGFSRNSVLPNGQTSVAGCDSQSAQRSGKEHQALAKLFAIAWFHPQNILAVSKGLKNHKGSFYNLICQLVRQKCQQQAA